MRGANPGSLQSKTSKVENGISSEHYRAHAYLSRRTCAFSGHSATSRPPIDLGPVPSAQKKFALHSSHFFWHLPFYNFPETLKKGALVSKPHFTRGFRPEAGPADTREHFHSMRKVIPDISILCPKSFHFREKCELENSKKIIRSQTESNVCR